MQKQRGTLVWEPWEKFDMALLCGSARKMLDGPVAMVRLAIPLAELTWLKL